MILYYHLLVIKCVSSCILCAIITRSLHARVEWKERHKSYNCSSILLQTFVRDAQFSVEKFFLFLSTLVLTFQYAQACILSYLLYNFLLLLALCNPGTYSRSGVQPCENCPPDKYQSNYGATNCEPCNNLTNTTDDVCKTATHIPTETMVITFTNTCDECIIL